MIKFRTSDRNGHSVNQFDDAALDTIVGGIEDPNLRNSPGGIDDPNLRNSLSPATNPVSGRTFNAKPALGTSH